MSFPFWTHTQQGLIITRAFLQHKVAPGQLTGDGSRNTEWLIKQYGTAGDNGIDVCGP